MIESSSANYCLPPRRGSGRVLLADLTAELIETYLRRHLDHQVEMTRSEGNVAKGLVKTRLCFSAT